MTTIGKPAMLTARNAAHQVVTAMKQNVPVSFYVGAGISMDPPSYLPDWDQFRDALLGSMIDRLYAVGFISSMEHSVIRDDFLSSDQRNRLRLQPEVVLQYLHLDVLSVVRQMFRVFESGSPNFNHRMLACLTGAPLADVLIATCNFDTHIEQSLKELELGIRVQSFAGGRRVGSCGSFREYVNSPKPLGRGAVPLLKIHGCITEFSTIQATIEQISRPMGAGARMALRYVFNKRHVIIAGYSGRDDIFPQIVSNAIHSLGVIWLAHEKRQVEPRVWELPNTTVVVGTATDFFATMANDLNLSPYVPKQLNPVSLSDFAKVATVHSQPIPTAMGLMCLGMHIGCDAAMEILGKKVVASKSSEQNIIRAFMTMGDTKRRVSPKLAMSFFQKANDLAQEIRNSEPLLYARTLSYLAGQHLLKGDLDRALTLNTLSTKWALRGKYCRLEALNMDDRATIFRRRRNLKYAIRLRKESARRLKLVGDVINLAMVYNNMGNDYKALKCPIKALEFWQESLRLKEKETCNIRDAARTRFNLGDLLRESNRLNEAYEYLVSARSKARQIHDLITEARALFSLGALMYARGKESQAKRLIASAERQAAKAVDWYGDHERVIWARKIKKKVMTKQNASKLEA